MHTKDSKVARVFFALWPEPPVRQALHALAKDYQPQCEARAMRADGLHMTLLFLGEVERASLPQLMQAAGKVAVPPFEFVLERFSFWLHNKIGYAAPSAEVPGLSQLAAALQQAVPAAGLPHDAREFKPHVTLLRHVVRALESQAITPIKWWANSFVLVESVATDRGVRYQILRRYPLASCE